MTIRVRKDIFRQGREVIASSLEDKLATEYSVFIGNPSNGLLFVDATQREIYIHSFGSESAGVSTCLLTGIDPQKVTYGKPIIVKRVKSGQYQFVRVDTSADYKYQGGVSQPTQEPVNLSQLRYGIITPFSGLQVLVTAAWYDGEYIGDITSGVFDGTATDTSGNAIQPPTTNNRQIAVLIQLDVANGTLSYKQGVSYSASIAKTIAYTDATKIPRPDARQKRIGYVFLKTGMTNISYGDIWLAPELIGSSDPNLNLGYPNPVDTDVIIPSDRTLVVYDGFIVDTGTLTVDGELITISDDTPYNPRNAPLTITSDFTVTKTVNTVRVDASSNAVTVTLPDASTVTGYAFDIKIANLSNLVTVTTTSSQTIDGSTSISTFTLNDNMRVESDGSNWSIL